MKRQRSWFLALLAMLWMAGAQQAKADENQPLFMIPAKDISEDGLNAFARITETNPVFTIFLWTKNEDGWHSTWKKAPELDIDGHKVTLSGLTGDKDFENGIGDFICYDENGVYYYVRTRGAFEASDNKAFLAQFPELKSQDSKGNSIHPEWDEDWYMPIDIIMCQNKRSGDVKQHKITVRGLLNVDKSEDKWISVRSLDDVDTLYSGKTDYPFNYSHTSSSLKWTNPEQLTFTSNEFQEKNWGTFRLRLDDQFSEPKTSGSISLTKEYKSPDYASHETKLVEYRYEGVWNPISPSTRYSSPVSKSFWVDRLSNIPTGEARKAGYKFQTTLGNAVVYFSFDKDVTINNHGISVNSYDTHLTLECLNSRIREVRILNAPYEQAKASQEGDPQPTLTMPLSIGVFNEIEVTFDNNVDYYPISFVHSDNREPLSLPYPSNVNVEGNPWNQTATLRWEFKNIDRSNTSGQFFVYRDTLCLNKDNPINASYKQSFSYKDTVPSFDSTYNYRIAFVPDGWNAKNTDISATKAFTLQRSLNDPTLEIETLSDGYELKWSINTELDKNNTYKFNIYRITVTDNANPSVADFKGDPIATIDAKDKTQKEYEYTDKAVSSTSTYAYMVSIKAQDKTFNSSPTIPNGRPNGPQLNGITATRGTYTDYIEVTWDASVQQNDKVDMTLYRHQINEGENDINTYEEAMARELVWDSITTRAYTYGMSQDSYKDESAKCGYYYAYAIVGKVSGTNQVLFRRACDGFMRSTGTVFGTVTYQNKKYAVEGVKVSAHASDKTGLSQFNALKLDGSGSIDWSAGSTKMTNYFGNAFSVQLYVNPDPEQSGKCLFDMGGALRLNLGTFDSGKNGYPLVATIGEQTFTSALHISSEQFTSVTLTYSNGQGMLYVMAPDSLGYIAKEQLLNNTNLDWSGDKAHVMVGATIGNEQNLAGYVDEVRFFKRQLTEADVLQNYNHYMGGTEAGLVAYWPFDENISTMRHAYDYSKNENGNANDNYALITGGVRSRNALPTDNQLALFAVTDTLGMYTIQGIPFAGEGTVYDIIPTKGVHEFNPTARQIRVSQGDTTFDPQDFVDESSFNVKGVVYYENTTYPVKGCRFYQDDTLLKDKDGNVILSDDEGQFTIPIGIGEHVIHIEKDGHTFLNNGCYPASGTHNFNDSISHLTFTDLTKAVVVGRVVGGLEEKSKPLGMGQSMANIGAATLTLYTSSTIEDSHNMNMKLNSEEGIFDQNYERLDYELANPDYVNCSAWVGGVNDDGGGVKRITIKTDPQTGEFAVKLPPVPYYISTKVDNNPEATTYLSATVLLDASDVLNQDTTKVDGKAFCYNASLVQAYLANPTITVTQDGNDAGAFGEALMPATKADGNLEDVTCYTIANDQVTYDYGYPIFDFAGEYTFDISSFERYVNYDNDEPIEYTLPTKGFVRISNLLTDASDSLNIAPLDSAGHYRYKFQALNPNIESPYTQSINISVVIDDYPYDWYWKENNPLSGIIFGAVLTGNTFVTNAPDKLINILRDPFGSNAYLTWEKGKTYNISFKTNTNFAFDETTTLEDGWGGDVNYAEGVPGAVFVEGESSKYIKTKGLTGTISLGRDQELAWHLTTNDSYSTSSAPLFDGPQGDVFIGASTSLTFGAGKNVQFINDQQGGWKVGIADAIVTGESIENDFAYSQQYIENTMIPNFKTMRNSLLQLVSKSEYDSNVQSYTNPGTQPIYMTYRQPDDPDFGLPNDSVKKSKHCDYGDSYAVFWPASGTFEDEVLNYNEQIKLWEGYLADNEESKVKCVEGSATVDEIYSYSSGTSHTITKSSSFNFSEGIVLDGQIKKNKKRLFSSEFSNGNWLSTEASIDLNFTHSRKYTLSYGKDRDEAYTITMYDEVNDNSHLIDIYHAPDGFSRIFVQRGGQTSRNYEDECLTKYYEPGKHTISFATDQIEVPHITCEQRNLTNIPEGKTADFMLKLSNATTVDLGSKINFKLYIENDKWSELIKDVRANGNPFVDGEYGMTFDPGQVHEVKLSVLPYEGVVHIDSLHVSFYSEGQMSISDDIILSAHFLPAAEQVALEASRTLVNTSTDTTLVLTASGYDLSQERLKSVRIQQRKSGKNDWTTLHSWVKENPAGDTESLLNEGSISTTVDMHNQTAYPDDTYEFRAVTDCVVGGEAITGESDIISVVKDVTLPEPLYLPEPADGVLSAGDNISIIFNEDIHSQSLRRDDNFIVQAVLNTDSVAHDVALRLDGADTPAATSQSQLTLSGTSFTLCSWVKNSGAAGTLFRHGEGQNALRVGFDEDGHLTANIKDENGIAQTYTSVKTVPKDIWSYVSIVYDVDKGTLSAYYASGDTDEVLIDGTAVGKGANSDGNIYLGEGLTGAMHEVSLFSAPLDETTILAQMYLGKNNTTPALIGYWRLDEGHGTQSEDRARSRHMLLATPGSWYMENENFSLALDGTSCAGIPMGTLSVREGSNYLVEMWALADESQPSDAQLFSLDNGQKLDLNIVDGQLQLVADSVTYTTSVTLTDHQWHHVAFNALKAIGGQVNLLVDGVSVLSVDGDKVPALSASRLWLGRHMKGMLDEVRLWHGTNTQETIAERMYYRMDGSKEEGLVGYWPMEYSDYDEYTQRVFKFSLANQGYQATTSTTLVSDGAELAAGSEAPGLRMAPLKSNLDIDFVVDQNTPTVSISLLHSPQVLEGCTVSTTLRDYYDMHSNVGKPVTWSFVVKQNPLNWDVAGKDVTVPAGMSDTFTATLTNNGEANQKWAFGELPSWLEASPSTGTIFGHGSQEVTFTVLPGNAIGKYTATISAQACLDYRGTEEHLDTPLDICLTVEGDKPDWEIDTAKYNRSMTTRGQIKIKGIVSTDPSDMVGAFTDVDGETLGECIGVGQPEYNAVKDAYYVKMMIFGTKEMEGDTIRFRLYDASTGLTYPLTTVKEGADNPERLGMTFKNNASVGNYDDPVVWENRDKLLQTVNLNAGSNWISLYLKPVRKRLTSLYSNITHQVESVELSEDTEITYNGETWSDESQTITAGQMMIVNMNEAAILPVVGDAVNPADYPITVKKGANWIGVPSESSMKLDEAFAGLDPKEGDQIKSQTAFSTYFNKGWDGNLLSIEPGKGYIYITDSAVNKQFTFPVVPKTTGIKQWGSVRGIEANYQYQHNMTVICTVHDEYGQPIKANSVEAYSAAGELRGRATSIFRDSLMQLVISGDHEGEPLLLRANVRGFDNGQYTTMLTFRKDQKVGSFQNPLVIGGGAATDISALVFGENSQLAVYNISGLLMYQGKAAQFDKSKLPLSAFYIILETTADGQTLCRKVKVEK